MSMETYYTAPSQEVFDDIKQMSIKIWQSYDNEHGYVDEKVDQIKDLENVKDNYMYMFSMFDVVNQAKLMALVKPETKETIEKALSCPHGIPSSLVCELCQLED